MSLSSGSCFTFPRNKGPEPLPGCKHRSEKEVQQSATLEEGPHQNLIMLAPWSWISSLQNFPNGFHLFLLNLEKKVHYRSLRRDESGQHFSSGDYLGTRAAYSER
ncbi:uncharacterized protein AAEQ78_000437 isoform 2-T8 [Lycaon pictus]